MPRLGVRARGHHLHTMETDINPLGLVEEAIWESRARADAATAYRNRVEAALEQAKQRAAAVEEKTERFDALEQVVLEIAEGSLEQDRRLNELEERHMVVLQAVITMLEQH
jgi:hypothetical protein